MTAPEIITPVGDVSPEEAHRLAKEHAARVAAAAAATNTAEAAQEVVDPTTLALLRNDLRGMSKDAMGALVAELTARMGVDPALAPIDILEEKAWNPDTRRKETTGLRLYINARGASELAKRWDLSDVALEIDIRQDARVVIVQGAKTVPPNGRIVRDVGASPFDPDRPDTTAQAVKKATTSCHRRVTLRAVGIFLDEPPEAPDAT